MEGCLYMENIILNNGVEIPILGFGTAGVKDEEIIKNSIKVGYRLLDTARMYDNEEIIGRFISRNYINRNELFITTKLCKRSNNCKKARNDIDDSLKRLNTDYVDLILIHEPYIESYEMYDAIKEAYISGKARAIGISNFNLKCYGEFIKKCGIIPSINQLEYHVYFSQEELKIYSESKGTKIQAWSPIVSGRAELFEDDVMLSISKKYGKTIPQLALKYLIQQGISVVPKTLSTERMKENFNIFDFTISDDDMVKIKSLNRNTSITDWYRSDWF